MEKRATFNHRNCIARSGTAAATYRCKVAHRLQELGYEIEHGKSGQRKSRGIAASIRSSSPRRKQIKEHLAMGVGAAAAQIAAHHTREAKIGLSHEEMQQRHRTWQLSLVTSLST